MAKTSGLPMKVEIEDAAGASHDLSNDITSITISTPRGVQDITGLDKSAIERLLLLADASIQISGVFNAAANMSHDTFKTVMSTDVTRIVLITLPPTTAGSPLLTLHLKFADYQIQRAANGALTWSVTGVNGDGTVPAWTNP